MSQSPTQPLPFCLPPDMSPTTFLQDYWQKKPLLIRQGLPALVGMYEPEDILALARSEEVTARLITQTISSPISQPLTPSDKQSSQPSVNWQLKNSPFSEDDLASLVENLSQELPNVSSQNTTQQGTQVFATVLVQNMEQWSPELGSLWQALDFIPQWQRDDIMVSYAPQGSSVGQHFDNYDVFLAQGYGSRRWQLGKVCDETTSFEAGQPIRILSDMGDIIFDEVLQAGDVLYVPSNLAHYGVAMESCLTFSFGFRRPSPLQLLDSLADVSTHQESLTTPLKIMQPSHPSGQLAAESIADIKRQLIALLQSDDAHPWIMQAIAETVSKRQYDLMLSAEMLNTGEIKGLLDAGAWVRQDHATRMVYTLPQTLPTAVSPDVTPLYAMLYINGVKIDPADIALPAQQLLIRLADGEKLAWQDFKQAGVALTVLQDWLENGWVWLDDSLLEG